MKEKYGLFLKLALAVGVSYAWFYDYLPPRTPRKVASTISGLRIPPNVEVLYFDEHWSLTDGYAKIALKISPESSKLVKSQTERMGYQAVKPGMVKISDPRHFTISDTHSTFKYEQKENYGDFSMVVWDDQNSILLVCVNHI